MDSDSLYNYFEEYNLNNKTIVFFFIGIFSFIIIINTYCIIKYFYKKSCKSKRQKYIEQNYDNHQDIDKQFYVISEPFV